MITTTPEMNENLEAFFAAIAAGTDYCGDVAQKMNAHFGTDFTRNAIIKRFQTWKKKGGIPEHREYTSRGPTVAEPKPILEPEVVVERDLAAENKQLRQVNQRIFNQLQAAKEKVEDLVSATIQGAYDAMISLGPLEPTVELHTSKQSVAHTEAALWVLTDWQLGKRTTSYNTDVCRERVMRFCRKAERITEIQRKDHPVEECVIAFLGDMIEGVCFQFPSQPHEIDSTFFAQFVAASRLMIDVVQYALGVYKKVTVIGEHGNHGRIGGKRDAVPRSDNLDRMCYELARQLLANESRLTWNDSGGEDIQRLEIGAYRAICLHSDEVGRNGYASPTAIVQYIVRQKSGAYPWKFADAYTGHFHTHMEWSLPDGVGAVYQTGSTESDNKYASVMMASTSTPSQRLHFVDPVKGRVTAQYKVYVDAD